MALGLHSSPQCTILPAVVSWGDQQQSLAALIDSGAEDSLIHAALVQQWETHATIPVSLCLSGNHVESITLFIIDSPQVPLVLGHPWLLRHNPQIDWGRGFITAWGPSCYSHCLRSAVVVPSAPEETPDISQIPTEYQDLQGVFSKFCASAIPPHCPFDCAIDLLPGTSPPRGCLYSLLAPERTAMEDYIGQSLAVGII